MDEITSRRMSAVKQASTSAETRVQRFLQNYGIEFTIDNSLVQGRPDICISGKKIAIFVHGCFWHGHNACKKGRKRPKTNIAFWENKILTNIERDTKTVNQLKKDGWQIIVVWECETFNESILRQHFKSLLNLEYMAEDG